MHIMIVEDSRSIRMLLTQTLEADNHLVISFSTGKEAVEYLKENEVDFILMDVELPGIDGFETTRQIRANENGNWHPIVYLSGRTEETLIKKGIDAGGDAYLTKPIQFIELKAKIKGLERIAEMRREILRANETLSAVLSTSTEGIYMLDSNGTILSLNQSACKIFGFDENEAIGKNASIMSGDTQKYAKPGSVKQHLTQVIQKQLGVLREVEFRRKSGERFTGEISINFVPDNSGGVYIGIFRDITKRKAYEQELEQSRIALQAVNETLTALSYQDGLTGIYNRRHFDESLVKEHKLASREQTEISIILCDIDHFKGFNDTYGHQEGDNCLQKVAKALNNSIKRPTDLVARYGGEEFVFVLPKTGAENAVIIAEKIRAAVLSLEIPNRASQTNQYVTLSLGVATIRPDHGSKPDKLLQLADKALYAAKGAGRNNVQ
ncbi:MAG: diguanylate cyclase [Pseudomonadales bacterium]|nr:diguanylate cyclase [Pseudomonadales bacterium]